MTRHRPNLEQYRDGKQHTTFIQADWPAQSHAFITNRPATAAVCPDPEAPGKCRRTYNDFCHQPCSVCGLVLPKWRHPGRVMVAHHRDPRTKRYSPSGLSRRGNPWWLILIEELRKCEPLCATCHAVVHDVMGDWDYDWNRILDRARRDVASWTCAEVFRDGQ